MFLVSCSLCFAEEVLIKQIEAKRDRGFDYLDIYTTGWSEAKGLLLENQLYIDFPNARISDKIEITKRKSNRIAAIQVTQKDKETARVIITLKKDIDYEIVNVFGQNKSVVEVSDRLADLYAEKFSWEKKNITRKTLPLKPVRLAPVLTPKALALKGKIIILDPGHGGDDPGALSRDKIPEKILTLKTAQQVAARLQAAGATVYLTRNEDRRSNLREISQWTNKTGADVLISLHYNATYSSRMAGTETYYYNPVSRRFAQEMHEALIRGLRRRDHGLHRTPFYIVKNTEVPSVLLEPVYLSNNEESDLANTAAFRDQLAEAIVKGVENYFRSHSR